jgi:hypothetical protein
MAKAIDRRWIPAYDEGKADQVLRLMSGDGLSLKAACDRVGVKRIVARTWADTVPEFAARLREARQISYEHWAEEILSIADSVRGSDSVAAVQAARVAIDSRKWLLARVLPTVYGDKVEVTGKDGRDLLPAPEAAVPRLMQVLALIMPQMNNSELMGLATTMAGKLNGSAAGVAALAAVTRRPQTDQTEDLDDEHA